MRDHPPAAYLGWKVTRRTNGAIVATRRLFGRTVRVRLGHQWDPGEAAEVISKTIDGRLAESRRRGRA